MKTKLISKQFGWTFGTLRFDKNTFLKTLLSFTPYWDYKPTNAIHVDSPGVYTNENLLNLTLKNKIHLKCNITEGSIVDGLRQPVLFSFVLDKQSGYKVFVNLRPYTLKK